MTDIFAELPPHAQPIHESLTRGRKFQVIGDEFIYFCPFHDDKRKPNLYVNYRKGVYHCFACGASGSTSYLLFYLTGIEIGEMKGSKILAEFWSGATKAVDEGVLESLSKKRGISIEILHKCDVRSVRETEYISDDFKQFVDRKLFPVYDRGRHCVLNVVGYSDAGRQRYVFADDKGVASPYGLHLIKGGGQEKLFVVEGLFDALSFVDEGMDAVALNGTQRYRLISRLPSSINLILLPDFDFAGQNVVYEWALHALLNGYFDAVVWMLRDLGARPKFGKDANDAKIRCGTVTAIFEELGRSILEKSAIDVVIEKSIVRNEVFQVLAILSQVLPASLYISIVTSVKDRVQDKNFSLEFLPSFGATMPPHMTSVHLLKILGSSLSLFIYAVRSPRFRQKVLEHFLPHEIYPILSVYPQSDAFNELPSGLSERDIENAIRHVKRVIRGARPSSFSELADFCEGGLLT